MTALAWSVQDVEARDLDMVEMYCYICGRFMAMVTTDYEGPRAHGPCDAQRVLTNVVPLWPDTSETRARLSEWARGYPGLPWWETFFQHRPLPRTESKPITKTPTGRFKVRCRVSNCPFMVEIDNLQDLPSAVARHLAACPGHSFGYERV